MHLPSASSTNISLPLSEAIGLTLFFSAACAQRLSRAGPFVNSSLPLIADKGLKPLVDRWTWVAARDVPTSGCPPSSRP